MDSRRVERGKADSKDHKGKAKPAWAASAS